MNFAVIGEAAQQCVSSRAAVWLVTAPIRVSHGPSNLPVLAGGPRRIRSNRRAADHLGNLGARLFAGRAPRRRHLEARRDRPTNSRPQRRSARQLLHLQLRQPAVGGAQMAVGSADGPLRSRCFGECELRQRRDLHCIRPELEASFAMNCRYSAIALGRRGGARARADLRRRRRPRRRRELAKPRAAASV